jgi:nicotinamide mononucleotide transporter
MVARKVIDNWLYWMVINSASIYLFLDRELYQTTGLLVLYIVLSVMGYRFWLKSLQEQSLGANPLVDEVKPSVYATASENSR